MTELIVCGYCTADAAHRVRLGHRLDGLGIRHDIIEVGLRNDGSDAYNSCKPFQIRAAMDRHPGKTILFIDEDCDVVGTRNDLVRAADIAGDVALHVSMRPGSDGPPVLVPHGKTLVLRPTARAYVFVSVWIEAEARAVVVGSDRDTLAVALARVPELSVTLLGGEFCAPKQGKHPRPVIVHGDAGAHTR